MTDYNASCWYLVTWSWPLSSHQMDRGDQQCHPELAPAPYVQSQWQQHPLSTAPQHQLDTPPLHGRLPPQTRRPASHPVHMQTSHVSLCTDSTSALLEAAPTQHQPFWRLHRHNISPSGRCTDTTSALLGWRVGFRDLLTQGECRAAGKPALCPRVLVGGTG